nr:hypothetical protein CFP56_52014 [Quercus suber]
MVAATKGQNASSDLSIVEDNPVSSGIRPNSQQVDNARINGTTYVKEVSAMFVEGNPLSSGMMLNVQQVNNAKNYFKQPFGNEEVANDDDVHEAPQNGDDVHKVGPNDDDVHKMHEGGNVDTEGGGGQDFDWLEEGFEGPDFDNDVFGNVDDGPSTHDGVSVNAAAPHRPFKGNDGPSTYEDLPVAFGQTASQPTPNNRFEAATQPPTRSKTSASVSTSGVLSQGSGGGVARGFKGKKFCVLRPANFQLVGGKGKKAAGKGTKSSK